MLTNEERREVASAMREEAQKWEDVSEKGWYYNLQYTDMPIQDLAHFAGIDGRVKLSELFSRFADLIEPEERTCEFDSQACGKRRCKRCGAFVSVDSVWDCFSCIPVRYCPNCGAKVASDAR